MAEAAATTSLFTLSVIVLFGLISNPTRLAEGTISRSSPSCLGPSSACGKLTPVALPPGCAKLSTRPRAIGSSVTRNTIGMVAVAAFAARAGAVPPVATISATLRRTRSTAISGRRSYRPSAKRYSIVSVQPLDVAGFDQHPAEHFESRPAGGCHAYTEIAHDRHRCLLRARRQRPRGRTAEQRDEIAPLHSITSSASNCREFGTSRPSALAVCRLMTNSNLVDCRTGRSAGFAPFRI